MDTSSQLPSYSITFDNTTTGDITLNTVFASGTAYSSIGAATTTYTISGSAIDTITLPMQYEIPLDQEWVNCFPEWSRINDMCKKYPGLDIAFNNFKTIYELVKDDYDNPVPKK